MIALGDEFTYVDALVLLRLSQPGEAVAYPARAAPSPRSGDLRWSWYHELDIIRHQFKNGVQVAFAHAVVELFDQCDICICAHGSSPAAHCRPYQWMCMPGQSGERQMTRRALAHAHNSAGGQETQRNPR